MGSTQHPSTPQGHSHTPKTPFPAPLTTPHTTQRGLPTPQAVPPRKGPPRNGRRGAALRLWPPPSCPPPAGTAQRGPRAAPGSRGGEPGGLMRRCGAEGEPPPAPAPPPSAAVTSAATGGSERGERAGRPSNAEWSRMGAGGGRGSWGRCVVVLPSWQGCPCSPLRGVKVLSRASIGGEMGPVGYVWVRGCPKPGGGSRSQGRAPGVPSKSPPSATVAFLAVRITGGSQRYASV